MEASSASNQNGNHLVEDTEAEQGTVTMTTTLANDTAPDTTEPLATGSSSSSPAHPRVSNSDATESSSPAPPQSTIASFSEVFSFCPNMLCRLQILGALCCSVVSGAATPAFAFFFATAFESLAADVTGQNFMSTIRKVAFTFTVIGVLLVVTIAIQNTLIELAALQMTRQFQIAWFRALLRQDMAYHDVHNVAGQATTLSTVGARFRKGVGRKLVEINQYLVVSIGGVIYSFYASWQVSFAVLAVVPFLYASTRWSIRVNTTQTSQSNASYAKAGAVVTMAVSSVRTILSLNAVPPLIHSYQDATQEAYQGAMRYVCILGLAGGTNFASMLLSYLVLTVFGSWVLYEAVRDDGCDPSGTVDDNDSCQPSGADVFGALMGITIAASVLPQVTVAMEAITSARAAIVPALRVMQRPTATAAEATANPASTPHALTNGGGAGDNEDKNNALNTPLPPLLIDSMSKAGQTLTNVQGHVRFHNVTFSYPARPDIKVFDQFTLDIPAGKTVALVGTSGCGKSTAVQLLERFYDPQEGSITLDGVNLRDLNVQWLRQIMGLVSQEPKLFAKTIRENIAMGAPDGVVPTQDDLEHAARMAHAHDFITQFPQQYDTHVGAQGAHMSGGQKQRIAIARVLIKNTQLKLLLLDEATSALDTESERQVQAALDELMTLSNYTTIVIAHRLSTVKNADMIAVVADGKVVETGTHEELLRKEDHYYRFVQAQSLASAAATPDTNQNTDKTNNNSDHMDKGEEALIVQNDNNGTDSSSGNNLEETAHSVGAEDAVDSKRPIIHFRKVRFRYPSRPGVEVFHDLNLSVHEGETLAIVGASGSGKSTIVQLIERFYDPEGGAVEFCGVDIKELNVRWLREQLGLVSQEPVLFEASIEENIRYGLTNVSQQDVEDVAKMANAHDFIMSFPQGYKTSVGPGSTLVSGGQKQRIALARALIRKPRVLLLDEATSALDSESEKIVQAALDKVMFSSQQTCVVIAHRLSTVQNADRIAVVEKGKVREIGTHADLLAKGGRYARLVSMQNLGVDAHDLDDDHHPGGQAKVSSGKASQKALAVSAKVLASKLHDDDEEADDLTKDHDKNEESKVDEEIETKNVARARLLAAGDAVYILVGTAGAVLAGLIFPAWGFIFAYMIEALYGRVESCDADNPPEPFLSCEAYWDDTADDIQKTSFGITYAFIGILVAMCIGYSLLFYGFGAASERMNKRVRDALFTSVLRQEVAWFDMRSPGSIATFLSEDAAMLHAFLGEPIRSLVLSLSSVVVGLVVSFIYMWQFALLMIATIPFLGFGAEMEMKTFLGADEGVDEDPDEHSPGGIAIETLTNIRTVASLTLEESRAADYERALMAQDPHPFRSSLIKGSGAGVGQFMQMWSLALMFWWGGWLLSKHPEDYTFRGYLISMFALFFSFYGLALAAQGTVNREKAKQAANRIFELMDRKSLIDPLSDEGKKDV